MSDIHSDALVFFGATGDLAYKKIFPSLQAMAKRGHLHVPVIGVAKAGWTLDQLRARAQDSVEKYGGLDRDAFAKLSGLLRYVDGDYQDPATFETVRRELGGAAHPDRLRRIPSRMLDEQEFLSPYGIRSLSRWHEQHPYVLHVGGKELQG